MSLSILSFSYASRCFLFFFFNDTATTEIYTTVHTLSLHDALPICQSILVGTPSGVTLGPEGGAHQSVVTPSVGIEQPACVAWEPAFGQDFEWCFLHALGRLGRPGGTSAYFRLSTRPIDQALAALPEDV